MSNTVPSSDAHLTARIEPPFAWLLIDNPERRNAVTLSMWQAMPPPKQKPRIIAMVGRFVERIAAKAAALASS